MMKSISTEINFATFITMKVNYFTNSRTHDRNMPSSWYKTEGRYGHASMGLYVFKDINKIIIFLV